MKGDETLAEYEQRMRELKLKGPRRGMHDVADELLAAEEKREREAAAQPKKTASK